MMRMNLEANQRRLRVVRRFTDQLLVSATQAGVIDIEEIRALQRNDLDSIHRSIQERHTFASAQASTAGERQRATRREVVELRHHFESDRGNPATLACLWFADSVDRQAADVETAAGTIVGTGPSVTTGQLGENIVELTCRINAADGQLGVRIFYLDWFFVWTPPVAGMATLTSWIQPNGTYHIVVPPQCLGNARARIEMRAGVYLHQLPSGRRRSLFPGQFQGQLLFPPIEAEGGSSWGKGYVGGTGTHPGLEDEIPLSLGYSVPINSQDPVTAHTFMSIVVHAHDGGEAWIDFQSNGGQINVPSAWIAVES